MTAPSPDDESPPDLAAAAAKASALSRQWSTRLDEFHLPCPLCKGTLVFHGVTPERLYEFAEGEPGQVELLELYPLIFICDHCGYTAEFDSELFNPAHLARLAGAGAQEAEALNLRRFRVLVALHGGEHSDTLLHLATAFVGGRGGEVIVLNAARTEALAEQVDLRLKHFHPAAGDPAPTRVLRRGTRRLEAVLPEIAGHEQCEWVLIEAGWPRGEVEDWSAALSEIVARPDSDVALVYDRGLHKVSRILFVTAGGPSSRAAAPFALNLARVFEADLHLLYVASPDDLQGEENGQAHIAETLDGLEVLETDKIQRRVVIGRDPVRTIVDEATGYDLLVSGGSPRGRRDPRRLNSLSNKIARNTSATSINVLATEERERSWLSRLLG